MTLGRFDLGSRVIVVTGGAGRIGSSFTRSLLFQGARVVVVDPNRPSVDHAELRHFDADVRSSEDLERVANEITREWGDLHGLVNCAALDSPPEAPAEENGPFETYPESAWDRILDVNLKGVFLACQAFGSRMAKAGRGSIVNIGSVYGSVSPDQRIYEYRGEPRFYKPVAYSASKAGLINLTRYLAVYWATSGVRVNLMSLAGVFDNQDVEFLRGYNERVPMGRMAHPGEYDDALTFLLSDASSYMTGSSLVLDGGMTAW